MSEKTRQDSPQSAWVRQAYSTRRISGFRRGVHIIGVGPGVGPDECFILKKHLAIDSNGQAWWGIPKRRPAGDPGKQFFRPPVDLRGNSSGNPQGEGLQ